LLGGANEIRYNYLDEQKRDIQNSKVGNQNQRFEASLRARISAFGGEENLSWVYGNDIGKVWTDFLQEIGVDKTG
jgi:hypothetical protein